MGGACSVGVRDRRISSDEVDRQQLHKLDNNNNNNSHLVVDVDQNNNNNNNTTKNVIINGKLKRMKSFGGLNKKKKKANSNGIDTNNNQPPSASPQRFFSGELRFFTPTDDKMAPRGSSFIGRAGIVGLEKAVDVLDALGSGMANLNSSGFLTGKMPKSNKIEILAFEVANTINRGEKLMQSLSKESVKFIKGEVIPSVGVKYMVSSDTKVLLSLVAFDKRQELDVFCKEVTRFGNHCKDPQWHNLERYFKKLDSESAAYQQKREHIEAKMQELVALADLTSELYHELNAFDRFEQDYRQKVEEMKALNLPRKGEHLIMLNTELRNQKKIVVSLKKKSLWSRKLEEVIEKLVDIVAFIRQEITEVFGTDGLKSHEETGVRPQRLGPAGLALHYANVINQMDNIASRPTALPPNIRDTLYRGLPASVKAALRTNLRVHDQELDVSKIKAEMETILEWLAPMAMNTVKMHQGFGWVGEWANASTEFNKKTAANVSLIRLQTLYHADKEKTDTYILKLVTLLHQLISGVKSRDYGHKTVPLRSPSKKIVVLNSQVKIYPSSYDGTKTLRVELSEEDRRLLERMSKSRSGPGISKSHEIGKAGSKVARSKVARSWTWSRSMGSSPYREQRQTHLPEILEGSDLELSSCGIEAPF